jgi:hypothetical protein
VAVGGELPVTDGVDPLVDAVQSPDGRAVTDLVVREAELAEPPGRDYPC